MNSLSLPAGLADLIGGLAYNVEAISRLLALLGLGLFAALVVRIPAAWRARLRRRRQTSFLRVVEKRERFAGLKILFFGKPQSDADVEEFTTAIGTSPRRYRLTSFWIAFGGALFAIFVLGSWALAIIMGVGLYYWRSAGARGRVVHIRDNQVAQELVPLTRNISKSLASGVTFATALADGSRGEDVFSRALRRALRSTRTVEEGLLAEQARAHQLAAREFFEILAEGASMRATPAATVMTLDTFATVQQRRQTAYRNALRLTSAARGQRKILMFMVPAMMTFTSWQSGFDLILHSGSGNFIIMVVAGLLFVAYILTNGVINGATRDF